MATVENLPSPSTERPIGFGRLKRKEDARFIRGKGTYLDDIRLPGMVHGAILRSPYAHARIVSIDTSRALAHPNVAAVVTAKDLETLGLAWMPTISYDTQAVLAGDKVRFQGQEVAFVIATDEYSANDALQLIDVEYEPLPAIVNARKALDPDAPLIRDDKAGQRDNLASPTWEAGDEEATNKAFSEADTVVSRDIIYPRCHPAPLETCGIVADFDPKTGQLNIWNGNQAPHAHRTVYAHVAGLAEHMIRIRCSDIGGGFGNKVPVYPGYVCAIAGSIVAGVPVKWIENRTENLVSTGFARDYVMRAEMCSKDGKITGLRVDVIADHGAFDSTAQPTKFPAGFFHIVCGSYDLQASHVKVKAVYTNKAPGGVAYRCSFRITEAVYLVERMVDALALEMKADPIDLRMRSFIAPGQFPYETTTGWTYDSGNYAETMKVAMDIAGYDDLRREQREKRERGELMGIGVAFFTEGVGAGPRKHMDILGLAMNDGADLRVHPSGKAVVSISAQTQGQGHETTFAQIVAEELGIPPEDIEVRHGDTDKSPYGLGTYGSRSTPVSGAAVAVVSRKVRDKARLIAATMLETRPEDLAWEKGRWYVKGDPEKGAMIEDIAVRAYSGEPMPEGMEGGLDAQVIYDPPNLTYPYGAYIAVVDIDPDTAQVTIRRFIAVDDCGVRINPMIVDGQIHGGLAEGVGIALMELLSFDAEGNCLNSSFMDYLIPTALECPDFELGETVTPCPHHPLGAKGVGESPNVGSPPAIVNAVIDALYETHDARAGGAAPVITAAMSRRAQELAAGRVPFVTATVVRAQAPTSVRVGAVALVLADGTIEGFVGGVCTEHSVRAYSLRALESGNATLLRILPFSGQAEVADHVDDDGTVTVQNPCLSGGAVELFLEPVLPAPAILVVGETPIASAVMRLGTEVGFEMVAVDGDRVDQYSDGIALVVAAHGRDEMHTLRRGLESGLPYVGLVASPKRGTGVLAELRGDGVPDDMLALIDVPAGIDIAARTPAEIALSILARIIAVRNGCAAPLHRRGDPADAGEPAPGPPRLAVDPICGMTVAAAAGTPSLTRDGETIYFCCDGCRSKYEAQHGHARLAD
jgi:carbon-monoxide dehydrogenase large subunit